MLKKENLIKWAEIRIYEKGIYLETFRNLFKKDIINSMTYGELCALRYACIRLENEIKEEEQEIERLKTLDNT